MKILHLSTCDYGGAGAAAFRLHKSLRAIGIDSKMLVLSKHTEDSNVIPLGKPNYLTQAYRLVSRVLLKIRSNSDYHFEDQAKSALNDGIDYFDEMDFHPDLIVAHWTSNFVSVKDLYRMSAKTGIPVVWHLMDMAPLTGGCHYAWNCEGYMNQCGNCPALYSNNARDMSSKNWREKYDCIQRMNITIVPASGWQVSQADKAMLFRGKRKEKIMAGFDVDVFKPCSRTSVRKIIDLPVGKKILFVGALSMKLRRKGMKYFLEALRIMEKNEDVNKEDIVILTAGNITAKKLLRGSSFKHIHLGLLNEEGLVRAYQASDVFVCPSIEDSGPVMINESIMCGTPVVAFDMGVSVDLVHTNITGYRATLMDSDDLARGISQVLNLDSLGAQKMSSNCRDIGLRLTSDKVQVKAFLSLFDEIMADNCA